MSSPPDGVVCISCVFDDQRHVYQLRASSDVFAQLHALTSAKYPLVPLFFHFIDEDGDRCRITGEAELKEALRVCGPHLTVLLSASLPLNNSPDIASPTRISSSLSSSTSPSPLLATLSPSPQPLLHPSLDRPHEDPYPALEDYLSSDEEDVWELARAQAKAAALAPLQPGAETEPAKEFGVVALDSDSDAEEDEKVAYAQQLLPPLLPVQPLTPFNSTSVQDVAVADPTSLPAQSPLTDASAAAAQPGARLEEAIEAAPVAATAEAPASAVERSPPDVLIAGEGAINRKITEVVLTRKGGFFPVVASTSNALLQLYRQHASSLRCILVLDGVDDLPMAEITALIRNEAAANGLPHVRIYACTTAMTQGDFNDLDRAGVDGCIPWPAIELHTRVRESLARSEAGSAFFVVHHPSRFSAPSVPSPVPSAPLPSPAAGAQVEEAAAPPQAVVLEVKSEEEEKALNQRLRAFYGSALVEQAVAASGMDDTGLGGMFASFFSHPAVVQTITTHARELTPPLSSHSMALYLHEVAKLTPSVASHPLLAYAYSVAGLHAGTTCAVCTVSPIVGTRYSCTDCAASLCGDCQVMGVHDPTHVLLPLQTSALSGLPASSPVQEEKSSPPSRPRDLGDRLMDGSRRVWSTVEDRLERFDKALTQYAAELKRVVEEMMDGVFPSRSRPASPVLRPVAAPAGPCDSGRVCMGRGGRELGGAGVVVEPPGREMMEVGRMGGGQWGVEMESIREMGLIHSEVEEATVRELLTASKGNIAQTVQWMMDRLEMGQQ